MSPPRVKAVGHLIYGMDAAWDALRCKAAVERVFVALARGDANCIQYESLELMACKDAELDRVVDDVIAEANEIEYGPPYWDPVYLKKRAVSGHPRPAPGYSKRAALNFYSIRVDAAIGRHVGYVRRVQLYHEACPNWPRALLLAAFGTPSGAGARKAV